MIAIRGSAGRAVLSFAQQVSLSVLGTLAATALLTALQSEWRARPAAPVVANAALPSLTDGGKFAARAIDGDAPEPFVTLTRLPVLLPLFTAPAMPRLGLDTSDSAPVLAALPGSDSLGRAAVPTAPAHAGPRRETRHVPGPPSRSHHDADQAITMLPLPDLPPAATPEEHSLLSQSRAAYQTLASWSGAVVDTLLP